MFVSSSFMVIFEGSTASTKSVSSLVSIRLENDLSVFFWAKRRTSLGITIQKRCEFHDFCQELVCFKKIEHFSITSEWCQRSFDLNSSVLCVVHQTTTLEAPDLWCLTKRPGLFFFKWVVFLFCKLVFFLPQTKITKKDNNKKGCFLVTSFAFLPTKFSKFLRLVLSLQFDNLRW